MRQFFIYISTFLVGLIFMVQCNQKPNFQNQEKQDVVVQLSEDSLELKNLYAKSKKIYQNQEYDSATISFENLIKKAKECNNAYYKATGHSYLGQIYRSSGNLEKAHNEYENAISFFKEINDSSNIFLTYIKFSGLYSESGDYNSAEYLLNQGSNFIPKRNSEDLINRLYSNFGYVAILQKDYDEAEIWFNRIIDQQKNDLNYQVAITNVAYILGEKEEFEEAKKIYMQLLEQIKVEKDSSYFAYLQNAYQHILIKENNPAIDTSRLYNSLKIRELIQNNHGIMDSYQTIIDYYILKKDTVKAIQYSYELLKIAKMYKSNNYISVAYQNLISIENRAKIKKLSLQYIHFRDSLNMISQTKNQEFARTIYEYRQNQNEYEILQNNTKTRQQDLLFVNLYIAVIIIGFLILLYFLINYFRMQKIKQEQFLESQIRQTEKSISDKVKKQISDGILSSIHYLKLHANKTDKEKKVNLLDKLEEVYELSRNISRETTYFQSSKNFTIELERMMDNFRSQELRIEFDPYSPKIWQKVSISQRIEIYNALQEIVEIMKRNSNATEMRWKIQKSSKELKLSYVDNSRGFEDQEAVDLHAFSKIHTRLLKIKGEFTLSPIPAKGIEISLKLPLN